MPARFEIDRRGAQALLVSSGMRAAMLAAAQEVAQEASRTAPSRSGALAGSYRTESATARVRTRRGGVSERAAGRVLNDSPHAAAVEFGHAGPGGAPVAGAHTLGRLAGSKRAKASGRTVRRRRRR
ncbi:HK97 gp10 family phage protein [Actinomyces faecalis]|uniref:HK97 gp10 family phage protein n=1 Tax=Actinomyces faecalis TaxID=2722820 RepID=UPI001552BA5E|nr:HK97 gp10 family phage protein [Actinomyces faecalis]